LSSTGTLGLIATNTIAQGDTRQVGLDRVAADGLVITRAVQSAKWPSRSANLEYAAVWGSLGSIAETAPRIVATAAELDADTAVVPRISTLLEPAGQIEGSPAKLTENENIAFQGCIVLGMGFVLEPEEAHAWIAEDERNREVLFPYLNGEDLNSQPDCGASRWVIDFTGYCLICAGRHRRPFERVERLVKPERMRNNRRVYRDYWWLYAERRPAMRRATAELDEVLAIARVSKSVMPVRIPTGTVASEQVVIYASDSFADQAVLSSSLHQMWAITFGSTLETRVRYTPSDVFETYPRPEPTDRLAEAGRSLDVERREVMLRRRLGLTKLYNLVNDPDLADADDPDVARMRLIHVELDEAVMAAYGWSGVPLSHGFHTYRQMERWTVCPAARVEIMDRLLAENLRRAAAQEISRPRKEAARSARGRGRQPVVNEDQGTLL